MEDQTASVQAPAHTDGRCRFSVFDLFDDGEYVWFTSIEYNALFMMDKQTLDAKYMGSFPDEETYGFRLYTTITENRGKLYFTPCSAHEIGVYDIRNKKFEKINIGISRKENDTTNVKYGKKFVSGYIHDNVLTLIPCCYDNTIAYHIDSKKLIVNDDMFQYFHTKYSPYISSVDQQFYLCWFSKKVSQCEVTFNLQSNTNVVAFYNLATGEFMEQKVGQEDRCFTLIEYDGTYLWLYDAKTDTLVRWKQDSREYTEICIANRLPEFQPCYLNNSFVNMAILNGWLYLIPANANIAVKVNVTTLEAMTADMLSDECSVQNSEIAYSNLCKISGEKLFLFRNKSKRFMAYDKGRSVRQGSVKLSISIDDMLEQNCLKDLMQNNHNLFGEEQIALTNFLKVVNDAGFNQACSKEFAEKPGSGKAGYEIYNRLKNLL